MWKRNDAGGLVEHDSRRKEGTIQNSEFETDRIVFFNSVLFIGENGGSDRHR